MQKLAEFIVRENYSQHTSSSFLFSENLAAIQSIFSEDLSVFEDSVICVALSGSEIVGSVRVTKWNNSMLLPIQKLFSINPVDFEDGGAKNVWHIGRFAISKQAKDGAKLLKKLISIAVYPICCATNSIMLAECDSKFVRVLNLMGLKTEILAKGITYLGSETYPIYSTQDWLLDYINQNSYYLDAMGFYKVNDSARHLVPQKIKQIAPVITNNRTILINGTDDALLHAV